MTELNSDPSTETCIFCLISKGQDKNTEVIKEVSSRLEENPTIEGVNSSNRIVLCRTLRVKCKTCLRCYLTYIT